MRPDELRNHVVVLHVVAYLKRPWKAQAQFLPVFLFLFFGDAVDMRSDNATEKNKKSRDSRCYDLPPGMRKFWTLSENDWKCDNIISKPYNYLSWFRISAPSAHQLNDHVWSASKKCDLHFIKGRMSWVALEIHADVPSLFTSSASLRRYWNAPSEK